MRDAESAVIERADYGHARVLTVSIRAVLAGGKREHWMLRARGPYDFRLMAGNHVPIQLCDEGSPLLAEDREPIDELEITGFVRSVPLVLGALYSAHAKWVDPGLMPFGTFFDLENIGKQRHLATGPRSFINAMRIALSRCEVPFMVSIVRPKPNNQKMAVRFGKTNYVRASKIVCEEVAPDRAIA